ncbi:MAG: hypothetical protein GY862_00030 [Gammaproteobacteria bacterium]|nr:hypothetical protein [Gammaproteobacteria bacterium]
MKLFTHIRNGIIAVLAFLVVQATQAFVLEIKAEKLAYALAEPVVLYVSVKNTGDEPAQLPAYLGPDFQEIKYTISKAAGGNKPFVSWIIKDAWEPVRYFASGEVREEEIKLFFSAQGWTYPTPGTYTITAEFAGQSSNPLTITVGNAAPATLRAADGDDMEAAAQLLLHSGQAGFFLLFEGGPHLTNGIEILEQIITDYPQTPHAAYARTALGNNLRKQGNYQEALALLNAAKEQPAGFYNTVHTHAFLYRTHIAAGNAEEAQAVLDSLEETVSEQFSELASFADVVLRDNGVPPEGAIHSVSGQLLDSAGNPIVGAAVRISGYPQTAVTDENGNYQIDGLRLGAYALLASKAAYVFEPGQVNIAGDGSGAELNLVSIIDPSTPPEPPVPPVPPVSQLGLITGVQFCDEAGIVFTGQDGRETHRINTKGTGIYLDAADFDGDNVTDIAITEIGRGDDALMFNAASGQTGAILTDIGKSGIRIAFADLDNDGVFEAAAASQAANTRVYVYRLDGTLIRELKVFDNATEFDLAAGDVNGDGRDEIILAAAAGVNGDTVFIFDGEGGLVQSFAASPDGALRVATGDINADGTDEIIVGEAAGYAVAVHKADGTLISAFDASGENNGSPFPFSRTSKLNSAPAGEAGKRAGDKISVCHIPPGNPGNAHSLSVSANALQAHLGHGDHEGNCEGGTGCSLYQGPGIVLASGDVNGDGRAEIIAAEAGGREVRVYTAAGGLLVRFEAAEEGSVITDAALAVDMLASPSLANALPNAGRLLENIAAGVSFEEIAIHDFSVDKWGFREVYTYTDRTNPDSPESGQFIEMYHYHDGSSEVSLDKARLRACESQEACNICLDPSKLAACIDLKNAGSVKELALLGTAKSGRPLLFATQALKDSLGLTPDYIIADNFLPAENGTIAFIETVPYGGGTMDFLKANLSYSRLPDDGICSLNSDSAIKIAADMEQSCAKYVLSEAGALPNRAQPIVTSPNSPNFYARMGSKILGFNHVFFAPKSPEGSINKVNIEVGNTADQDWKIQELYSNEDGSVQFIELYYGGSGETSLAGAELRACNEDYSDDGVPKTCKSFALPDSRAVKSGRPVLFATPSFGALPGGVSPDYRIDFNFLAVGRIGEGVRTVEFSPGANSETVTLDYTKLPTNGICSLNLDTTGNTGEEPACSGYSVTNAGLAYGVSRNSPAVYREEDGSITEGSMSNGHSHAIFDYAGTGIFKIPAAYLYDIPPDPTTTPPSVKFNPNKEKYAISLQLTNPASPAEQWVFELMDDYFIRNEPAAGQYAVYYVEEPKTKETSVLNIPTVAVNGTYFSVTLKLISTPGGEPAKFEFLKEGGFLKASSGYLKAAAQYPNIDIELEMDMPKCIRDKLQNELLSENLPWPDLKVEHHGVEHTLQTIFSSVGINVSIIDKNDSVTAVSGISSLCPSAGYTDEKIHTFLNGTAEKIPSKETQKEAWEKYIHVVFLTKHHKSNIYGVMASGGLPIDPADDTGEPNQIPTENNRNKVIVFVEKFQPKLSDGLGAAHSSHQEMFLRELGHEIGHALNLGHNDGENRLHKGKYDGSMMDVPDCTTSGLNVNKGCLNKWWDFRWGMRRTRHHFLFHNFERAPDDPAPVDSRRIKPGTKFGSGACHGSICGFLCNNTEDQSDSKPYCDEQFLPLPPESLYCPYEEAP